MLGVDCDYVERVSGSKELDKYILEIEDDTKENPNYFIDDYQKKGDRYHVTNSTRPDLHIAAWR